MGSHLPRLAPLAEETFVNTPGSPIRYLRSALDISCAHHEKWDGTGNPLGLHGEQTPLVARIFAVFDVGDALRSDRLYRTSWSVDKVREHLRSLACRKKITYEH